MNELPGKETISPDREDEALRDKITSLEATVRILTEKLTSAESRINFLQKNIRVENTSSDISDSFHDTDYPGRDTPSSSHDTPKSSHDTPSLGHDTPSLGHDTPSLGHDTPKSGHDTPSSGDDTPKSGHDTPSLGHDTPSLGHDTPSSGDDTPKSDHDTPSLTGDTNPVLPDTNYLKRSAYKRGIIGMLKKVDEVKTVEITQVLSDLRSVHLGAYEKREDITKTLEVLSSYLSDVHTESEAEIVERVTEEKVFQTIKKEIMIRLRRLDLMRCQSDRLTREVIFWINEPMANMQRLTSYFHTPRITISRDLKVFRKIGWVKTIGRGPTARYDLTDEARKFISQLMSQY